MVSSHLGNNRIIKNTILLYFRMILLILVQLYIVPVILRNLGVADYGLYNVIAGVVTMFSFLGGSDLDLLIPKTLRVCFDSSN